VCLNLGGYVTIFWRQGFGGSGGGDVWNSSDRVNFLMRGKSKVETELSKTLIQMKAFVSCFPDEIRSHALFIAIPS